MTNYFGIDFGGTTAKLALVSPRKQVLEEIYLDTSKMPSAADICRKIGAIYRQMPKISGAKRIGVGVAGDIDGHRGIVRASFNLGWKNVPLKKLLEKSTGAKVTVDNDANAAAWGIYQTQVSSHVKNILVVTLGTGVGGGIILDGRLHRGATGSAGEIGHMVMDESGRRCNCGLKGCLETYAGGIHIVGRVLEALAKGQKSRLQSLYKENPKLITPKSIADAALKQDKFASQVWEKVGHALGVGLGNLIYVLNPEIIFLAGGVSQASNLILRPLKSDLAKRPFQTPVRAVQIKIAKNPANMGVIGAALL